MRAYLGFGIAVALCIAVQHWYGPIGWLRMVGACFVVSALWFVRKPELQVHFGQHALITLTGAEKAFVLVPAAIVGLAMLAFAPELTCVTPRYAHYCR